jgi:spermidine synthase
MTSRQNLSVVEQNNATGGVSYWQGADNQSLADRNGISLADYIHAMYGFIRQAKARHVLLIGCGGGTLATMLHRARVRVTMVDNDPASFAIALTYFSLPQAVACHAADGLRFLEANPARYDAIVLDAYNGGAIPKPFLTRAFFALVRARLKRGGILLANFTAKDDADRTPDRVARTMQTAFGDTVKLHDADGYLDRNVVAVAGATRALRPPRLLLKPARRARSIAKSLRELDFRLLRD